MAESQDRNLPASARKIEKARKEGQVARSRDLAHLAMIGGGGALLAVLAPALGNWLRTLVATALRFDAKQLAQPDVLTQRLAESTVAWLMVLLPLGAIALALAVGAALASGGWNFTLKALEPRFSKLDPLSGLGRMVSADNLSQVGKASVLALVLGVIGAAYLATHLADFHEALNQPLPGALRQSIGTLVGGLTFIVLALVVFAAIDVPLQRFMLARRLKMSYREMKDEFKEAEGNIEVKAKVRARMREMIKRRMLAAVPGADLVVMNPTHYAVALKYEEGKMAAPRVVAKGADLIALKIRDIARDAKVPVLQSPALARALYAHTEVDQEVPARLFQAVAQVLAYVYQLRAALAGRGAMPGDAPTVVVPPDLDPHHKPAAATGADAEPA